MKRQRFLRKVLAVKTNNALILWQPYVMMWHTTEALISLLTVCMKPLKPGAEFLRDLNLYYQQHKAAAEFANDLHIPLLRLEPDVIYTRFNLHGHNAGLGLWFSEILQDLIIRVTEHIFTNNKRVSQKFTARRLFPCR